MDLGRVGKKREKRERGLKRSKLKNKFITKVNTKERKQEI